MQDKYQNIITEYTAQILQYGKISNRVGYAKLAVFPVVIVCAVFLFVSIFALWAVAATAVTIAVCVVLWVWHYRVDTKVSYARGIVAVCNAHIARISGEWTKFSDAGQEFVDFEHPYAYDLDIVGPKSLFQFLNTTQTWHGRQSFARDLLDPQYSPGEIQERQRAIAELSRDINFANHVQFYLSQIGGKAVDAELVEELTNKNISSKVQFSAAFFLLYIPVATVLLLLCGMIFQIQPLLIAGTALAAAQTALYYITRKTVNSYLRPVDNHRLGKYVKVIEILTTREFSSTKLNGIKSKLQTAANAVRELEKIATLLSIRGNPLIYFALNTLLLWDLHCAFLLQHWKKKYSHTGAEWFAAIGEFESLLAFSALPNVCNNTCLPVVSDSGKTGKRIEAKQLGHPLLSNEIRINNDLHFNDNIFIISGSNMSGKTTFMRTVGINLLLARAGSFVCAREMACSQFDIITSMRIADDLNEGVSTFYAELKKIKRIINKAGPRENVLFLIDEIFKGTNSVDRLAGADAVISKLANLDAAGMISTHDLELCKLSQYHARIINHSFSEHYQNGEILFDYKLQTGQSKTTNAKFLMEMLGII